MNDRKLGLDLGSDFSLQVIEELEYQRAARALEKWCEEQIADALCKDEHWLLAYEDGVSWEFDSVHVDL